MKKKRIGQFEVDSGRVLIVDEAYVNAPQEGSTWAVVPTRGEGIYPVYEFEHQGTIYAAFAVRPADTKEWEGILQFSADRLHNAREQAGEKPE